MKSLTVSSREAHWSGPVPAEVTVARVLWLLLIAGFQATTLGAQSTAPQEQSGTGAIEGTALDSVSGKPVKDVNVVVVGGNDDLARVPSAKADDAGHFVLSKLDAGDYVLTAEHPRYPLQAYGSRNGLLGATRLSIRAGEHIRDLTFRLHPSVVISGKAVDRYSDPVQGARVTALKAIYRRGRPVMMAAGTAVTDDRGEFRLGNLLPGRYFLCAMPVGLKGLHAKSGESGDVFVTTYYPNATEISGAVPVLVNETGEIGSVVVRLLTAKSVRLKGTVNGVPSGQAVIVRLIPRDASLVGVVTAASVPVRQADGAFDFTGVTPGSYTLRVTNPTRLRSFGSGVPIEVGARDIEGIKVDAGGSFDVSGIVITEGSDRAQVKGIRVSLDEVDRITMMALGATVAEDGVFTLDSVPPEKYFVYVSNVPNEFYVSSVGFGTNSMRDDGMTLSAGTGKLEIRLRRGGGEVDGVVVGADDKFMPGATVALIPEPSNFRLFQTTFTNQHGEFSFKRISPGDYKVLAWEEVELNAYQDPEFVKPFEGKAEKMQFREGDHKSISIKAISAR